MTRKGALPVLSLLHLLIFCAAIFERDALASVEVNEGADEAARNKGIEGCVECGDYRCPGNSKRCLLGSVLDPCKCCANGICARLDGESCWNSSIPGLPSTHRNNGQCARNYECRLRTDLREQDDPQAICVCMEQTPACGSDNKTYTTPCALHEEAMRRRSSSFLTLQHLGPCQSRPWILSPLEDVLSVFGQRLALNCEAKGFPVPEIFWEFHAADGRTALKLPGEAQGATVHSSVGPEHFMRTSWMQLPRVTKEYTGMYHCIARNSWGEAISTSFVSMLER